jgi:hypothetical protein
LAFLGGVVGDNRAVKRGLLLTGFWLVGVTARVASHVAPQGVARLSAGGVDRELASPLPSTGASTPRPTTPQPPSSVTSPTTRPSSPSSTAATPPPPPIGPATSVPPTRPPATVAPPPTTTLHNTVTTSQGGTVWTRCASAEAIVYVAAVPKSGYQRTHDVESAGGITEWFENGSHRSKITAECSDGSVHAEVEEEGEGGD